MIWLGWRQQRTETAIAALVFAIVAAVIVPTGLHIASVYDDQSLGACLAHPTDACRVTLDIFDRRWQSLVNIVA